MSTSSPSHCPRCGSAFEGGSVYDLCAKCLGALNFATQTVMAGEAPIPHSPTLTPEQLAPHFPQLEILECLGRGGMGVVYKARQKSLNRLVALKLLAPERADDPQFAARFEKEAQALAALNHPHIVAVYDFGVVDAIPPRNRDADENAPVAHAKMFFLLMEFVDGVNLRQAMKAGRFTPEQALAIVPPVCEALQYAHEHGIVHRDIKPENLLLDKEGRVKIADFGIAKMLGESPADSEGPQMGAETIGGRPESVEDKSASVFASVAGTPQYMAPEQRAHRATDHRADIYSLGVVLYELLTGELPADKLQPPSRKVQIDVRIDEIVLRALEKIPELRYQTAAEFRTQVEVASGSRASDRNSGTQETRPLGPLPTRLRMILWAICTLLLLNFAGPHITHLGKAPELTYEIGLSQPWLVLYPQYADNTRHVRALAWNLQSSAFLSGIVAIMIGVVLFLFRTQKSVAAVPQSSSHIASPTELRQMKFRLWVHGAVMLLMAGIAFFDPGGNSRSKAMGLVFVMAIAASVQLWLWLRERAKSPPEAGGLADDSSARVAATAAGPSRFSHTAIVGACWILFMFALVPLYLSLQSDGGHAGPAWPAWLAYVTRALGFTAPFGTTILGWVAVSQIRRSAGSLYGLGLAVFDGLLFPLLALDGLIFGLFRYLTRIVVGFYANRPGMGDPQIDPPFLTRLANDLLIEGASATVGTIATVIMILVVDFFIIRAVWRAASSPTVNGGAAPADTTAKTASASGSGCLRILAIFVMVALAVVALWVALYSALKAPDQVLRTTVLPVRVIGRTVIVRVTAHQPVPDCEMRMVLEGPPLSGDQAAQGVPVIPADVAASGFKGIYVMLRHSPADQPWTELNNATREKEIAFVLPDEALAQAALHEFQSIDRIEIEHGRAYTSKVFEVGAGGKGGYRAALRFTPLIRQDSPQWVEVIPASAVQDGKRLELTWKVQASRSGMVTVREGRASNSFQLRADPDSRLWIANYRLTLTEVAPGRVRLQRSHGGYDEMDGSFEGIAQEMITTYASGKTERDWETELCRISGTPVTVQIADQSSAGSMDPPASRPPAVSSETKATVDPVAAIEMKVAQQQLEKTLTAIEEAQAEADSLSSQFGADHPKVKEWQAKLRALEDKAARHREIIKEKQAPLSLTISGTTTTGTINADLSQANLAGAELSKADLSNVDLSNVDLSNVDLSKADLSRADLSHAAPGAAYMFAKSVGGWLYMAGIAFAFYIARRRTGLPGFGWLLAFAVGALALALVKFFVMWWLAYAFSPQAVGYAAVAAEVLDILLYGCAIMGSFTLVLGFRRRQQSQSTHPTKQP